MRSNSASPTSAKISKPPSSATNSTAPTASASAIRKNPVTGRAAAPRPPRNASTSPDGRFAISRVHLPFTISSRWRVRARSIFTHAAALLTLLVLPFVSHASRFSCSIPSLSKDQIAFRHADDIWTVARTGGEADSPHLHGLRRRRPVLLARRPDPRLLRPHPRQRRCLHRVRERRRPASPHLASRPGHRRRLVSRWQGHPLPQRPRRLE